MVKTLGKNLKSKFMPGTTIFGGKNKDSDDKTGRKLLSTQHRFSTLYSPLPSIWDILELSEDVVVLVTIEISEVSSPSKLITSIS